MGADVCGHLWLRAIELRDRFPGDKVLVCQHNRRRMEFDGGLLSRRPGVAFPVEEMNLEAAQWALNEETRLDGARARWGRRSGGVTPRR
jgi:hypothetical protein